MPLEDTTVLQEFGDADYNPLSKLPTLVCPESGKRYVPWKDIQDAFQSIAIDFIQYRYERVALMMDLAFNPLTRAKMLFERSSDYFRLLEGGTRESRHDFLEIHANTRYWSSVLRADLKERVTLGFMAEHNRTEMDRMLTEIERLEQQTDGWDYKNTCYNTVRQLNNDITSPAPSLFLVLPSDLGSWDDTNPDTHTFKCYFLCEARKRPWEENHSHEHLHLANHPGHTLLRRQEFFQKYGNHVWNVLRMVQYGYSDNEIEVPSLESGDILSGQDPGTSTHCLSRDNIAGLVTKSITYLEQLGLPRNSTQPRLSFNSVVGIKDHLDFEKDCHGLGHLHQYTTYHGTFWMCQQGLQVLLNRKSHVALEAFVAGHGGCIDMQRATLNVKLHSEAAATEFADLLTACKYRFYLTVDLLGWAITRTFLREFVYSMQLAQSLWLGLIGVTPDIHPQNNVDYKSNICFEASLDCITLLNYPQPGQQCTFLGGPDRIQFQSMVPGNCSSFFQTAIECIARTGRYMKDEGGRKDDNASLLQDGEVHLVEAIRHMSAITGNSVAATRRMMVVTADLIESMDLKSGCIDLHLKGDWLHYNPTKFASVRQLTIEDEVPLFEEEFESLVQHCLQLEEINVASSGRNLFLLAEHLMKLSRSNSGRLLLTMFERPMDENEGKDARSRILIQVAVDRHYAYDTAHASTGADVQEMPSCAKMECKQWNDDLTFTPSTILQASLLDRMTNAFPTSLKFFTLDISKRPLDILVIVQDVLHRSRIDYLRISCDPIDPQQLDMAQQILRSIEWTWVRFLVLSGVCLEPWIKLLATVSAQGDGPEPLHLAIEDASLSPQPLSHTAALELHQIVYSTHLDELRLTNIHFQLQQDRQLVLDALDADVVVRQTGV
ncbi:hypothetical protein BGZ94_005974 [Podila epigama]|nr:hypothetical protein BGZ94_005974 [Podila epigama]